MKKFAFFAAMALLTSVASESYAYYAKSPYTAQSDEAPNLYERNRQYNANAGANQSQRNDNRTGYRSSYYYQDKYYRYNSNPTNVYPDYNANTPNNSANWENANSPYRGDYQGAYQYRSPY